MPAGAQDELARVLQKVRERVAPSVVTIEVARDRDPEGRGGAGPADAHVDYYNRPEGPCTGTIWTADGYIVTSAFNVSGDVKRITVRTSDGKAYEAKRLGFDQTRDIALLKIEAEGLPVLAKAADAKQGDLVAVVGRAPDPDVPTLNHGIVSATNRMNNTAVQTDAELNYGNVGGPLVTLKGELVGVTGHVKPRANWGQSGGVGFATKHAEIDKALPDLKNLANRAAAGGKGPWLGITPAEGAEGGEGVPIGQVAAEGPGEEAGLQEGDVILEIEGRRVKTWDEVRAVVASKKAGDTVRLKIKRHNPATEADETKDVKVKLGESP